MRTTRRAVLAATLAAPALARAQSTIRIRFAHSLSTVEPAHQAAEFFARNVAARTNNRVQIEVFPGEQLGSGRDVNEMIRQGANVMNITDPGYLSDFVPDVGILNGPYLVEEYDQFGRLLDSDWYRGVDAALQKAGFRMVMMGAYFGARHMIADRPIRRPAEMAGMTVRVPPNQMWIETFRSLGARPTTVQWSDIYNALQQNVVQAAEAPYGSLWGARLQEVRKVISATGHFQALTGWPINNGYFNRLPAEVRTVLLEEGGKAQQEQTRLTREQEAGFVERFRGAGVEIVTDLDHAAFRNASAATYKAFPKWTPGLYDTVRKLLA
ncbi:C4-dicarboxylate TRAP transporter substrate-binding protein [Roseicella sp. DB1501]|uniref:C4-dicarboxylate TRAP transporter substrate-binding protein n=1 Tax=Roseicella sp. DB1501 TaxID=2730925 RepID=UPI001490B905|nr:C4-dicarboxylate TRAP transporter substrate-binding protein [Roseicella sp. DB1501]NOG69298.1 TRAP transporter substrate-binding protein DctP [Roseicella sp. DB1501]